MKIERIWAMPSAWTFTIKPIANLLKEEIIGLSCDPFAGENSPATVTNDLNPERPTTYHMDAIEFLKSQPDNHYDTVLLDPPYSLRQVSEHYKEAGIKVKGRGQTHYQERRQGNLLRLEQHGSGEEQGV